jgi:hypothetical protein
MSLSSRPAALSPACVPDDYGIVAMLAYACGVQTETLGTIFLVSAVLLVWQKGQAFLKTLGVLSLAAALTMYAHFRRVRRQMTFARLCAAGLAMACAALAHSPPDVALPDIDPAIATRSAGAAVGWLLLRLFRRSGAAPREAAVAAAKATVGESRFRRRGLRKLKPKQLPAALEEVWQLHTDGLLLQAAELLAEVEAVERAAAEPPPAGVAAARRTLEGHRVSRRGGSNSGLADGRHVRYSGMRAPHRRRTR